MKLERFTYPLAFLLLIIFTSDLQGQFRRKKVKLSQNNQVEEFINDYIQDPFMVEHIQALQSELVDIGFEILPPETDGNCEVEILFEDFNFDPYLGSIADPKKSYILFRDPTTKKLFAKFYTSAILQDDEVGGPMTNSFSNPNSSGMGSDSYGSNSDMLVDVNAIILDWVKQIKLFY
mgnify:CR=1 FL=1|tara:strand:+ start:475 stop:1005 length:531 start_codon:yes stop_codon:yes gene_type:complete